MVTKVPFIDERIYSHELIPELKRNCVLVQIIETNSVQHPSGKVLPLNSAISVAEANALYRVLRKCQPETCIEVGMAYGVSTLTILTALKDNGKGRLISIDPYPDWQSGMEVALANVERTGLSHLHMHIREPSFRGLPKLLTDGLSIEFAYIDGWHSFDHVFVDFFFCDQMLKEGGIIGFDDTGWRSVFRVIQFVRTHRKYNELDVGLPVSYRSRNWLFSLVKRLSGRCGQNRYFQKLSHWQPPFNFYASF